MKKILLVESDYRTKYPNLALRKISTKYKNKGHDVHYFKGIKKRNLFDLEESYDEIFITTLFTYEYQKTIDTIKFYKKRFPDTKINVGGIMASMIPEEIEKETGIKPFEGYSKELDMTMPDYSIINTDEKWQDFSFVFTSRGCVNKCKFCAVPTLESGTWINPEWRNVVNLEKKSIMIHDNNLTSMPIEHFNDVCDFIKEHKLKVTFDNGFDCRKMNEDHMKALQGVKINGSGLRLAFDGMQSDGHIQKAIELCAKHKIAKSKIMVYVLYNFKDKPSNAEYRMRELVNLKVRPYPQQYTPLDKKARKPIHIGKYWTKELLREFRYFYLMAGYYGKQTFEEYCIKFDKKEILEQFKKY